MRRLALASCALLASCLELSVPPAPTGGTLQGTLVYYRPGRATAIPAAGAVVAVRSSSVRVTAGADGRFLLPVSSRGGTVLITLDLDGDGRPDRQKTLDLLELGARPGRDVALGEVTLGLNASLSGRVLRGDVPGPGGHRGTTVLVPEGPAATTTSDDGSFLLAELPEGALTVAFLRDGYDVVVQQTQVRAGEELRLTETRLSPSTGAPAMGALSGRAVLQTGAAAPGVRVQLARDGVAVRELLTDADGAFRFEALGTGAFALGASRSGLVTVLVRNLVVAGGETRTGDLVMAEGESVPPDFSGTALPDAGLPDAGAGDGGAGDGGAGGGVADGGLLAVITPSPIPVALGELNDAGVVAFTVSGAASLGPQPLEYVWESLDVGDGLQLETPASAFSSSATYFFSTTPPVRTFRLRMFVRDGAGRESGWATAEVRAGFRPIAVLSPASVLAGGAVTLSTAGSNDPGNLVLTPRFSLVSGVASLTAVDGGVLVQAAAPGRVVVGFELENTFGLVSRRVTSTIDFTAGADAGLLVDAGAAQTADAGALVRLSGSVLGATGPFSARWSEPTPTTPALVFDDPTSLSPTFVAPTARGGNQPLRVQLEVRSPPNCSMATAGCLVSSGETVVTVLDRAGPVPTFQVNAAAQWNRWQSIEVTFDEPLAGAPTFTLQQLVGPSQLMVGHDVVQESSTRVRVVPRLPLAAGFVHRLTLDAATDATTAMNASNGVTVDFPVREGVLSTRRLVAVTPNPSAPRPGVALVSARPGGPVASTLVVGARRDSTMGELVLTRPLTLTQRGALPPLVEDTTLPPQTGLTGTTSARRLVTTGSRVWAGLEVAAGSWSLVNDGALASIDVARPNPQWVRHVQPPPPSGPGLASLNGPLFTDDANLFSVAPTPDAGVRVLRFSEPGGWLDAIANPAAASEALPGSPTLLPGQVVAAGSFIAGQRNVALFDRAAGRLTISTGGPVGSPFVTGSPTTLPGPTKALRAVTLLPPASTRLRSWVVSAPNVSGSDTLRIDRQDDALPFTTPQPAVPPGVVNPPAGFDLMRSSAGLHVFLAVVTGGRLLVWRQHALATPSDPNQWRLLDGLNPDDSFQSPGCEPANPELAVGEDEGLFVVWSERCGPGPWDVVLARVD